MKIPVNYSLF